MVEQTPTSVEQTKFSLLYIVEQNQTMVVEQNHTMPVEQTNVTPQSQVAAPVSQATTVEMIDNEMKRPWYTCYIGLIKWISQTLDL